jgi:hypothetical protein
MAKSDSFFIRANVNCGQTSSYNQTTVDLGAYVDALGKSVLRIHNIAIAFTDATGTSAEMDASSAGAAQFQLCTQSQSDTVLSSNKAVIASGLMNCRRAISGTGPASSTSESFDNLPQLWTNGYLVAVDAIYFGGEASSGFNEDVYCSITMECTVETMSQAAAMALALSQQ